MVVREIPTTHRWVCLRTSVSGSKPWNGFRWEGVVLLLEAVVVSGCTQVKRTPKTICMDPVEWDRTRITHLQVIHSPPTTKIWWTCTRILSPVTVILKLGKFFFMDLKADLKLFWVLLARLRYRAWAQSLVLKWVTEWAIPCPSLWDSMEAWVPAWAWAMALALECELVPCVVVKG